MLTWLAPVVLGVSAAIGSNGAVAGVGRASSQDSPGTSPEAAQAVPAEDEPEEPAPAAATSAESQPASRWRPFDLDAPTATGDWGGVRNRLEEAGIRFNLFYNQQFQSVVRGGLDTNGHGRGSGSIDAFLSFDLSRHSPEWTAELLLHGQRNWGRGVNPRTGALSEVNDDADGRLELHVAQLWYRHRFWDGRVSLMLGFLDYQTIVDRNAYANSEDKQFWNQSLDNNPFLPLAIGLGAALTVRPCEWYTLIVGAADAQSVISKPGFSTAFHDEDLFRAYFENDFHVTIDSPRGPLAGDYRVGLMYDPIQRSIFPRHREKPRSGGNNAILYANFDQQVYRESADDDQGLGLFARFGYRNPERYRTSHFWSAGLSYTGLVPTRDQDVLGLGFAVQRASHVYRHRADDKADNEVVYELYYAVRVSDWCWITPDVQYVANPGAAGDVQHALAAGVRLRLSF
ncbi:MAG: hypothetical protein C4547_08435 [Phycisphaerales bacterium]|nr:MAG: hypothetical protein C4547_08435 [Phycisphaerales bacterium]